MSALATTRAVGTVRTASRSSLATLRVLYRAQPFGTIVVTVFLFAALFGPMLAPYDPNQISLLDRLGGVSWGHLLGTDEFGRDILSRVFIGARIALIVSVISVSIALVCGTSVGIVIGFYQGSRLDYIVSRFIDALLAFPAVLLAIALAAMLGPSLQTATIAIGVVGIPVFARLARSAAVGVRSREYTLATKAFGASDRYILARTITFNAMPPIIVQASLFAADAVMFESALSFLGIGVQLPTASWGAMLSSAKSWMHESPLYAVSVGAIVACTIIGLNLFGDAIRVATDPKLRRRYEMKRPRRSKVATGFPPRGDVAVDDRDRPPAIAAPDPPLLEVRDLHVTFKTSLGNVHAVRGLDLVIGAGEKVALVGESACGKSVTALAVLGLLPSQAVVQGALSFRGSAIPHGHEKKLRRLRGQEIGMVFQDPTAALNPMLTVGRQIEETLRAHLPIDRREARTRVVALLDAVGIPAPQRRVNDYPHQFSGGMRQRVMIAIAIACEPALLIADEPTTGLDVTIQAQILELIAELSAERGTAVLLITHDLGIVAGFCERVAVVYAGRVVEQGPTESIFENPRHPYTQGLLASVPRLDQPRTATLANIPGLPPDLRELPRGCPFIPRCPHAFSGCEVEPVLDYSAGGHGAACWWAVEAAPESSAV
jgi:peptide/nickel transport system permease protein